MTMMVDPSAGSEIQSASRTTTRPGRSIRGGSGSRTASAPIISPSEMRAAPAMIAGGEREVDEHDGDAVGARPGAVAAPDDRTDRRSSTGPTIRPRLIMSRETSTSGAGPSRRVENRSGAGTVWLALRSASVRHRRRRRAVGSYVTSRDAPWAAAALLALGFVLGHACVVAVPEAGEHADRAEQTS